MDPKRLWLTPFIALSAVAISGCSSDDNDAEPTQAGSCVIVDIGDGNSAIRCPDGTELVVKNGQTGVSGRDGTNGKNGLDGANGKDGKDANPTCALTDNGDGTHSLTCGDKSVIIGDSCEGGFPGDVYAIDSHSEAALSFTLFQVTGCTWIRGNVFMADNPSEVFPKALSRIEKVDGSIYIGYEGQGSAMKSLSFPKLKSVGEALYIVHNLNLTEIGAFPVLESARFVVFYDNPNLESIGSFDSLANVEGYLVWDSLPVLTDMGKFPKLASLGELYVGDNGALQSLADFPLLETISSNLYVGYNDELTSIAGLGSLTSVGDDADISMNPKLPQADVDELFDGIEAGGDKTSCGNKDGDSCVIVVSH